MSSYGEIQARLQEKIRLEEVRQQCAAVSRLINERIVEMRSDVSLVGFLGETNSLVTDVSALERRAQASPDATIIDLRRLLEVLDSKETAARAGQQTWSEEKRRREEAIMRGISELRSVRTITKEGEREISTLVQRLEGLRRGPQSSSDLLPSINNALLEASRIKGREAKEWERREIVKRLIESLKKEGFSVAGPVIAEGVVTIQGSMPSGRKVVLEVRTEGHIHFDFNGYSGDACKNELDVVLERLVERGIGSEIEQFVWHNPDKLKKGAKDLPLGPTQRKSAGK